MNTFFTALFLPKYYMLGLLKNDYVQYLYASKVTKSWAKGVLRASGSKIIVNGTTNIPRNETVLIVSNHQSNFDIPLLIASIDIPFGFIAKKELSKFPVFSLWMKYLRCTFIDRENARKSLKAIITATKYIEKGYSQMVFPEGTRSKCSNVGEFKKGSLKLATKTNTTILPVTVNNTYKGFEEYKKITKTTMNLTIHTPIKTSDLSEDEKNDIVNIVRTIITSGLKKNAD